MNAVQLELQRQLYKAQQDIQIMQAIFNSIEAEDYYKENMAIFSKEAMQ